MGWFDSLLWPIMWVVAWVMVTLHSVFDWLGLGPSAAWALSIVGLTIVIRMILIPLFFRQIKASRGLQLIQPEIRELQKKYKGKSDQASREAMAREQMELYKKHNTNPFSSCLPILAQSPVFFALFRVLNSLRPLSQGTYARDSIGPLDQTLAGQAESAKLFGAPLSDTFMHATTSSTRVVTVILIVAMSGAQFFMQRQLTMKNMPPGALEGPIAQQQKMLMYLMPLIFAFTGINFPVGVLIYWTVSNFWTVGQQFYAIRRMPAPGSQAEAELEARRARKVQTQTVVDYDPPVAVIEEAPRPVSGQRQQPMSKARAKKQGPKSRPVAPGSEPADATVPEPTFGTPEVQDAPELDLDGSGALEEKTPARSGKRKSRSPYGALDSTEPDTTVQDGSGALDETTGESSAPVRPNRPKKPKKS